MRSILALETSSDACSVALLQEGEVFERFELAPRQHTQLLLPMVEQILSEAGLPLSALDAIAFGRGPGAFTGVRIATGVVQGLAYAAKLPVIPVSTLMALAYAAYRQHQTPRVLSAIDARMGELYWAGYECDVEGVPHMVVAEQVATADRVTLPGPESGQWYGIGSGWGGALASLQSRLEAQLSGYDAAPLPRAGDIARLAAMMGPGVAAQQALPIYLRDQVVQQR